MRYCISSQAACHLQNGVHVVERSIRDMEKLMPALPVQQRLLNGQMWLTFRWVTAAFSALACATLPAHSQA